RRLARIPKRLEHMLVAKRIHRQPEAIVPEGGELAILGQALQRLLLPDRHVVRDVFDGTWLEHEEPAIDPCAIAARLLAEARDEIIALRESERAEAPFGLHRRHRGLLAAAAMEVDELR